MQTRSAQTDSRGFTLMEMMIVVVIIGILVTAAVTSYSAYSCRANQSVAKKALGNLQLAMEKFKAQNGRYFPTGSDINTLPGITSPVSGSIPYTLQITSSTEDTFIAQAQCSPNAAKACELDGDPTVDIWEINNSGELRLVQDDCTL